MTWNLLNPKGSVALDTGDNKCRQHFDHLEDALSREHEFPGRYGLDAGRHTLPVASSAADVAAIPDTVNGMIVGRDDIAAVMQMQGGSFVGLCGVTYGTIADRELLDDTPANIPPGYRWVDSDAVGEPANPLWVWTGSEFVRTMREEGFEIGSIKIVTYSSTPTGWLLCDGAEKNRATYADLFYVIGESFGSGNGTTTFNLPDLEARSVFGVKPGVSPFDVIGNSTDVQTHNHGGTNQSEVMNEVVVRTKSGHQTPAHPDVNHTHDIVIPAGDHLPPFLTLRFLIKY